MSLQKKVIDEIRSYDRTWVNKIERANERGCPDLLCCVRGVFLAIEIKEGTDRVSPIQRAQMEKIAYAEGDAWVVRDFVDFKCKFFDLIGQLNDIDAEVEERNGK